MNINFTNARNFTKGRQGYKPVMIVNHIMAGYFLGTRSWFDNPNSKTSAHFGISKKGEIDQYVKVEDTAWHANPARNPTIKLPYPTTVNPNLYTIGIEWEGFPGDVPTEEQYQAGLWLHKELLKLVPQKPLRELIVGHYQINSVNRSDCPGKGFPWERLYKDLEAHSKTSLIGPAVVFEGKVYDAIINKEGLTCINGEALAEILGKNNLIPVRKLSEALGFKVHYDTKTKVTTIKK